MKIYENSDNEKQKDNNILEKGENITKTYI